MSTNFIETLGLRISTTTDGHVLGTLDVTEAHVQPQGVVHGGVYSSIGETIASLGAFAAVQQRDPTLTVVGLENHTSFLRTVRAGGTVAAEGIPKHAGRRVHLWTVTMRDQATGRELAMSTVRLLVVDPATLPG